MLRLRFCSIRKPERATEFEVAVIQAEDAVARHVSLPALERAAGRKWPKIRAALALAGDPPRVPVAQLERRDSELNKYMRKYLHSYFEAVAQQLPAARKRSLEDGDWSGLRALEQGREKLTRMIERRRAIANESETERMLLVAALESAADGEE